MMKFEKCLKNQKLTFQPGGEEESQNANSGDENQNNSGEGN